MNSTRLRFSLFVLLVALLPVLVPGDASAGATVKREIRLTPTAAARLASGKAKFEQRNARMKFSVEGEDLGAAFNGNSAVVSVNGTAVGTARVSLGGFDLNLDTIRRQAVPSIKAGDSVSVSIGGVNVLNGTF